MYYCAGNRGAVRGRLPRHIHHSRGAILIEMGEILIAHCLASNL
jgi:hypothetical protein